MNSILKTGYTCFLIATKFLGIEVPKEYEEKFNNEENIDFEIVRAAKELNLKVYYGKLKLKKIDNTTVPIIAKLKDNTFILLVIVLLGIKRNFCFKTLLIAISLIIPLCMDYSLTNLELIIFIAFK